MNWFFLSNYLGCVFVQDILHHMASKNYYGHRIATIKWKPFCFFSPAVLRGAIKTRCYGTVNWKK